jgi:branched-subunit amino acid aminotransferase/4-amino-4-deoxychorismate lyase
MGMIFYNGGFHKDSEKIFTVANRGFLYGDGWFDSIRVADGKLPLWNLHYARILDAAALLGFNVSSLPGNSALLHYAMEVVNANHIKEGRIRLSFYRNSGGLYAPETDDIEFVISGKANGQEGWVINEEGLELGLTTVIQKPLQFISRVKSANAMVYVLAGREMRASNCHEMVLLNQSGNVCETISSNLFVVINGAVYTPPLSEGCVAGIMRQIVVDLASEVRQKVFETPLRPSDLLMADEVFLTNSIAGIKWVGSYKNKKYQHKISSMLAHALPKKLDTLE